MWKQSSWITDTVITGAEMFGVPDYEDTTPVQMQGLGLSNNYEDEVYLDGNAQNGNYWHSVGFYKTSVYADQGIPAHDEKIAYSQSLYILKPQSLTQCLDTGSYSAWYIPESIDFANNEWIDISGNNNNANISFATGLNLNFYDNELPYITGSTSTAMTFGAYIDPTNHTVFNVAKYAHVNASRSRILQTTVDNGIFGFHGEKAGVGC